MDNNIGKLRLLFKEKARGSFWDDELHVGNPAAHYSVKNYQSLVLEEQTMARIFPTQAVPIFLDKLRTLCFYLMNHVVSTAIKPSERFVAVRDLAFFSVDFFSGDRGSDLERAKLVDVLTPPPPRQEWFYCQSRFWKDAQGMKETSSP